MATPSKAAAPTHRLLYRGSLSLVDSYLPLDGLSFSTKISDIHSSPALLNNPLALTLESMRGLPLHLLGTVKVKDTWIDPPGDILVDIHPEAALTRIYFENIFCLTPVTSPTGRTEYGVRVSLTENNDPDTPDLLIYGELRDAPLSSPSPLPLPSTSTSAPKTLHLLAARILPGPPPPPSTFRLPRPDDPTPRKPPAAFGAAKRKRDAAGLPFALPSDSANKRAKPSDKGKGKVASEDAMRKAAAEVMLRMPKPKLAGGKQGALPTGVSMTALGKDARVGGAKRDKAGDVFKVPSVPLRAGGSAEADVFGSVPGSSAPPDVEMGDAGVEKENKAAVKRAVSKALAKHGMTKTHAEFQEVFQTCYRGASFSLRRRMKAAPIDAPTIDHFVDAHVKLYVVDAPP